MNKCTGLLGTIFGHKYEARYSESGPTIDVNLPPIVFYMTDVSKLLNDSKEMTYEYDVCCRCGNVVKGEG